MIISCSLLWTLPCVAQKCSIHKLHYKVWLFLLLTIYICLHHSFTSAVSCRLIPLKRIISRKMTIVSLFIFLYFIFLVRSTSAEMVSFVGATGKWEKAIMVVFLLFCLFFTDRHHEYHHFQGRGTGCWWMWWQGWKTEVHCCTMSLSGVQIAMTSSSGRLTGKTAVVHCPWKQLFGKHYQQYDCSLELQKG